MRRKSARFKTWAWSASSLPAIVLGGLLWSGIRGGRTNPEPPHSPEMVPFTTYEGSESDASFSPDGSRIAFTWTGEQNRERNIFIKRLNDERPSRVTFDPADEFSPVWSPDGSQIAFLRRVEDAASPDLVVIPAGGGRIRAVGRIADPEGYPRPIAWWPDGKSILARDATERGLALVRIDLDTGRKQALTSPPPAESDSFPVLAPGGSQFAFVRLQANGTLVCLLSIKGSVECIHRVALDHGDSINGLIGGLAWLPDESGLLYCDRIGIWRLRFGPPPTVTKVVEGGFPGMTGDRLGQRLVFTREYADVNLWRIRIRDGSSAQFAASSANENEAVYSPDGREVCFRSNRTGTYELWLSQADGTNIRKLTSFGGHVGSARWSPDGKWITFDGYGSPSDRTRYTNVYVVAASGGPVRRITDDATEYIVPNWSSDQKWIYVLLTRGANGETWKFPFEGMGKPVRISADGMFDITESSDGRFLYFTRYRGPAGIWRRRLDGGQAEIVPGTGDVQFFRYWQLSGPEIWFVDGVLHPKLFALDLHTGKVRTIVSIKAHLNRGPRALAIAPDGSCAVYTSEDMSLGDIVLIEHVF